MKISPNTIFEWHCTLQHLLATLREDDLHGEAFDQSNLQLSFECSLIFLDDNECPFLFDPINEDMIPMRRDYFDQTRKQWEEIIDKQDLLDG